MFGHHHRRAIQKVGADFPALDPLFTTAHLALSNGDLTVTNGYNVFGMSMCALRRDCAAGGVFYWEYTDLNISGPTKIIFGVEGNRSNWATVVTSHIYPGLNTSYGAGGYPWQLSNSIQFHRGTTLAFRCLPDPHLIPAAGAVISMICDFDAGAFWSGFNGVMYSVKKWERLPSNICGDQWDGLIAPALAVNGLGLNVTVNFGATPFIYPGIMTTFGAKAWGDTS